MFSFATFCIFTVSENKTLCHPASVDSLSTSAGTEDHVSMGGFAARKALQVVRNVEKVVYGISSSIRVGVADLI